MKLTPKQARRLKDLSTTELATAIGVCRWTYEKLEKTPERFTMKQAEAFCKAVEQKQDNILFVQTPN